MALAVDEFVNTPPELSTDCDFSQLCVHLRVWILGSLQMFDWESRSGSGSPFSIESSVALTIARRFWLFHASALLNNDLLVFVVQCPYTKTSLCIAVASE